MKVLNLTLKREYFNQILSGKKKEEYRQTKLFWIERFTYANGKYKHFDEILFRNGYRPNAPFMRVEFLGFGPKTILTGSGFLGGKECFVLKLGKILEVGNIGEKQ